MDLQLYSESNLILNSWKSARVFSAFTEGENALKCSLCSHKSHFSTSGKITCKVKLAGPLVDDYMHDCGLMTFNDGSEVLCLDLYAHVDIFLFQSTVTNRV